MSDLNLNLPKNAKFDEDKRRYKCWQAVTTTDDIKLLIDDPNLLGEYTVVCCEERCIIAHPSTSDSNLNGATCADYGCIGGPNCPLGNQHYYNFCRSPFGTYWTAKVYTILFRLKRRVRHFPFHSVKYSQIHRARYKKYAFHVFPVPISLVSFHARSIVNICETCGTYFCYCH